MNKVVAIIFYVIVSTISAFAQQIQVPASPQFSGNQPVYKYNEPNADKSQNKQHITGKTNQAGIAHRQEIIKSAQTPENSLNLIKELQDNIQTYNNNDIAFIPNPERTASFPGALQQLNDMLSGKANLSVADAYYAVESAYGDTYLTKQQYDSVINRSAFFIKTWMKQNGLDMNDNYMLHFAIKKFMSETLSITTQEGSGDRGTTARVVTHEPFRYDYKDYGGEEDMRNTFVTKCLATGYGQCASMPIVYLILAEKLEATAYLSIAPEHSFIKHPDNSGYIINYEPTSNWELTDKWYKESLFISPQAVRSGIYLDTLNTQQVVANCIFDLAVQYIRVDATGDEKFIFDCLHSGIIYFPENNNLKPLFIYSMYLKTMLREGIRRHNIQDVESIAKVPEVDTLYRAYRANEAYIRSLGYQDMPAGMYEALLEEHEFKGKIQANLNISGKEKRNLFIETE